MQLRRDRSIRVYDQLTAGQFSTSARLSGACWQSVSGHHRGHFRCLTVATSSIGNWARRWQVSTCRNVKPVVLGYYISAEIARLGSAWSMYIRNKQYGRTQYITITNRRPTNRGPARRRRACPKGRALSGATGRRRRAAAGTSRLEHERVRGAERVDADRDRGRTAGTLAIRPENCVYG